MAHYEIFRKQLALKYSAFGRALWEPDPGGLYRRVEVGDVGYVHEGRFHRLFNALLPADHESHRMLGVPEHHEPLTPRLSEHIDIGILSPHHYQSPPVSVTDTEPVMFASRYFKFRFKFLLIDDLQVQMSLRGLRFGTGVEGENAVLCYFSQYRPSAWILLRAEISAGG